MGIRENAEVFKLKIKHYNGATFEYEQDTSYPLLSLKEQRGEKSRELLLESIERICKLLGQVGDL